MNEKKTGAIQGGGSGLRTQQPDEESLCRPSLSSVQVLDQPPKARNQPSEEPWLSTPSSSPFIPTPPCSQPNPSASQPLSRQSTASSLETASSSSSLLNDGGDDGDDRLHRILTMVKEVVDKCRICWVRKEVTHPHNTFRCPTKICSGSEWKTFRSSLQFPPGVICFFCFAPYGPPFNHTRAPLGIKPTPDLCEYPDVLKELVHILYQDPSLREKIFANLGAASPSSLHHYKRYIAKVQGGGCLGVYKVVSAYLNVREQEGLSA